MNTKTKGILSYLILAFGITWIIWEIPLQKGLARPDPLFRLMVLCGSFGPALAGIVVRKWITREGFSDAGLRLNTRKWQYYIAAWCLPLAVAFCIALLVVLLGLGNPDFSPKPDFVALTPGMQLPPLSSGVAFILFVVQLMVIAVLFVPLHWGEEFGWRSYLQIRLLSDRPVLAAVATGIIWAVWHYPLIVRGFNYPENPGLGLILYPVSTILLSIYFGWLRLKTKSIWSTCLAHSAANVVGVSIVGYLFVAGPTTLSVIHLDVLMWVPLGILCAWIVLTGRLSPENQ